MLQFFHDRLRGECFTAILALLGACSSATDSNQAPLSFTYAAEVDTFPSVTIHPDSASWHLLLETAGQREFTIYTKQSTSTAPLTRPIELILRLDGWAVADSLPIPGTYFPPGVTADSSFVSGAIATEDFIARPVDGSFTIASVDSFHVRGSFDLRYQASSASPVFQGAFVHLRGAYSLGLPEYIAH